MSWLIETVTLLNKFPWPQIVLRPRDKVKRLEEFAVAVGQRNSSATSPATAQQLVLRNSATGATTAVATPASPFQGLPSTTETIEELRRRLAKELYRIERDLAAGARIAGKPCDCLGDKHSLGIESLAEELIPLENRQVYSDIVNWLEDHKGDFRIEEVAKRPPEYYRALAPEARRFRKEVLGTESLSAMKTPVQPEMIHEQ